MSVWALTISTSGGETLLAVILHAVATVLERNTKVPVTSQYHTKRAEVHVSCLDRWRLLAIQEADFNQATGRLWSGKKEPLGF